MGVYRKKHHTERDRTAIQSRSIISAVYSAPDWLSAMAVFVFIVARWLIFVKPFSVRSQRALEGFDYFTPRCIGPDPQSVPIYLEPWKLNTVSYPAFSARGMGTFQHIRHIRENNLSEQSDQPLCFFSTEGKIRFWAISMHDGESVGMTEGCNESEPNAQGGDEMIHPVGFAGTRIISFQY